MRFMADFHVHSRFSRATSKTLDLERLYMAAQLKGISVIGTGDFTHPGWLKEIIEKLVPAEPGLFRLKETFQIRCDRQVPRSCHLKVRFILTAEIGNIYKKSGKIRKNHNLIFLPDLEAVRCFNAALSKIGNICSDGRPILGLDVRHLLDILLEIKKQGFLVPAHIWTPWFSVLGSKSGFDSIEDCFEDLSPYVFALETGLSSDPPMNRRVSALDRFTLISNSDAHSPQKLGREANIFNTDLSYSGIRSALQSGDPQRFLGTVEFFPQEGKYHLDGHRNCFVRMKPQESLRHHGICPQCTKPLTLGVLYRVEELADRPDTYWPQHHPTFTHLTPLTDILSEILGVGAGSKRVQNAFQSLLKRFGPEFDILQTLRTDELEDGGIPLLGEAVKRMRAGRLLLSPGYDGVFGTIKIFKAKERERLKDSQHPYPFPILGGQARYFT
ncbi:MAG: endonuclease Q family protein [Desulfobacterales bacterium]